jgi:hypothetical protein
LAAQQTPSEQNQPTLSVEPALVHPLLVQAQGSEQLLRRLVSGPTLEEEQQQAASELDLAQTVAPLGSARAPIPVDSVLRMLLEQITLLLVPAHLVVEVDLEVTRGLVVGENLLLKQADLAQQHQQPQQLLVSPCFF